MINLRCLAYLLLTVVFGSCQSVIAHEAKKPTHWFVPNKGQWEEAFAFRCDIGNGAVFLEKNSIAFNLVNEEDYKLIKNHRSSKKGKVLTNGHAYRMNFVGASQDATFITSGISPFYNNYYLGNDASKWKEKVNAYSKISYSGIYNGVNLDVYFHEGSMKYDFIVEPLVDPNQIRIEYNGVEKLKLNSGNLYIETAAGRVIELKPKAWNLKEGVKQYIECRFRLRGNILNFEFPKGYDSSLPLVIDPVLVFASYSGSTADNWGYTATYDDKGFLYAGGIAFGVGYPYTTGAWQTVFGGGQCDIAISKYDTSGSFLVYSTYLGGNISEVPGSMVVNNNYQLLVLGITGSSNYPTTSGAFDQTFNGGSYYQHSDFVNFPNGSDIVISKLSLNGGTLISSTFVGGTANDGFNVATALKKNYADDVRGEIKVDLQGNVYVASSTLSTNFPVTPSAYQTTFGGPSGTQDAVVFKMDNSLSNMIWASYLGGSLNDAAYSLVVNANGHVYAAGGTTSANFPTSAMAFQNTHQGDVDGFISLISKNGQSLLASTLYGTPQYDQIFFLDVDRFGIPYVSGQTSNSTNYFITPNAAWNKPGGGQFISKFQPHLNTRYWSTTFGTGNGIDVTLSAFMVDLCGNIYVSAWGGETNYNIGGTLGLPVSANAFQINTDDQDFYFLVIQNDASALVYATFYGGVQTLGMSGEHVDGGTSRFDKKGIIYQSVCAGCGAGYDNLPTTPGAWSNTNNSSNCNNAVIKFDFKIPLLVADFLLPSVGCAPYTANFINTSYNGALTSFNCAWDFGNGQTSNQINPSCTYTTSGVYTVRLIISSPQSCNQADTITKQLLVLSNSKDTLPTIEICPGDNSQIGVLPVTDPLVTYSWFPGLGLSSSNVANPFASPVTTTWYRLLISNGICTDTLMQEVIVHYINADAGNDTTYCTANLVLTGKTSSPANMFHWSSSPSFTNTLNSPPTNPNCTVPSTGTNTYYLKVYNNIGCFSIDSVVVGPRIIPVASVSQAVRCHNECNGSISSIPSGGALPYSFVWSNGGSSSSISGLCPGVYFLTVTDNNGCFTKDSVVVDNPPPLLPGITSTHVPCQIACIGKLQSSPQGGQSPYTYNWNTGGTASSINNLCPGTYFLTLTDSRGCVVTDTSTIIDLSIGTSIHTSQSKDTIFQGQSVLLNTTLLPGYTYSWQPATGLSNPGIHNPVASPKSTTTYIVTLFDIYGCTYSDTVTIVVLDVYCEEPYIFIPNAFTPNNDLNNDVLYVRTLYAESAYFAIYNRWGERLFETTDLRQGWDGIYKGVMSQAGVYVFVVEVKCFDGRTFTKKGNVTLIR